MNKKTSLFLAIVLSLTTVMSPSAFAVGGKEATASLLLPTTGQAMNGQLGNTKTKVMGAVEVASIATIITLGIATGGAAVLFGAIPLAVNHVYSSADAYKNAKYKQNTAYQTQVTDAQTAIEASREQRFDREQQYRSDVHRRVMLAAEQAN